MTNMYPEYLVDTGMLDDETHDEGTNRYTNGDEQCPPTDHHRRSFMCEVQRRYYVLCHEAHEVGENSKSAVIANEGVYIIVTPKF